MASARAAPAQHPRYGRNFPRQGSASAVRVLPAFFPGIPDKTAETISGAIPRVPASRSFISPRPNVAPARHQRQWEPIPSASCGHGTAADSSFLLHDRIAPTIARKAPSQNRSLPVALLKLPDAIPEILAISRNPSDRQPEASRSEADGSRRHQEPSDCHQERSSPAPDYFQQNPGRSERVVLPSSSASSILMALCDRWNDGR